MVVKVTRTFDPNPKQYNMKKIVMILAAAFLITHAGAQVDRTKKPAAGPAPVITFKDPVTFQLPNGITVLIAEDHKLPKVSASFYIDAGPVTEGKKAGVQELMGSMLNEGTKDMPKAVFDEEVDKMGANVGLSASGGNASALTRYFKRAFELMGKGLMNPAFTQESFDKLKSQVLTGIKSNEKNVKAVSGRVVDALFYGKTHPNGEFETEQSVTALTLADVVEAYHKYITPSRSYLTIAGDISPEAAKKLAEDVFGKMQGPSLKFPVLPTVANPSNVEIDVVGMSNAVQSEITVGNLVDLRLNNPDYFAVLLANQVLGGGAESRLFNNLREKHGFTYGAYSGISAGRYQTMFSASASVRTPKTDSAVTEFLNEIEKLRNEKVSDEELNSAKALYNGSFALGMENRERTAGYARNILINELPKDFYRTYLQKINAVTADDIQRVVRKYFNRENVRIVVVGNASAMLEGLKKLNFTVKQFDTYADPLVVSAAPAASASVKASDIFSDYLKAIGGTDELGKVRSIYATMGLSMQGMNIDVQMKEMVPNMKSMTMAMAGNTLMKTRFNGTAGYQEQQGNKVEMTADEIKEEAAVNNLFEQIDYLKNPAFKAVVNGTEKLNGSDVYKVTLTYPTGKAKTEYYDMKSKFLLKTEETKSANGTEVVTTVEFANYKKAGNIMFPYSQTITNAANGQSQSFELKATDVKINEGVTADDFK